MLFINHRTNAQEAKDYFTRHMERSDYYLRDSQEMPGEWHGLGKELLTSSDHYTVTFTGPVSPAMIG